MRISFITREGMPYIFEAEYLMINQDEPITMKQEAGTIIIFEVDPDDTDYTATEE